MQAKTRGEHFPRAHLLQETPLLLIELCIQCTMSQVAEAARTPGMAGPPLQKVDAWTTAELRVPQASRIGLQGDSSRNVWLWHRWWEPPKACLERQKRGLRRGLPGLTDHGHGQWHCSDHKARPESRDDFCQGRRVRRRRPRRATTLSSKFACPCLQAV